MNKLGSHPPQSATVFVASFRILAGVVATSRRSPAGRRAGAIVAIGLTAVLDEEWAGHDLGLVSGWGANLAVLSSCAVVVGWRGWIRGVPVALVGGLCALTAHVLTGTYAHLYFAVLFIVLDVDRFVLPLGCLVGLLLLESMLFPGVWLPPAWIVLRTGFVVMMGIAIRRSRELNASLALLSLDARDESRQHVEQRLRDQRTALSRDLHDELGHHLTAVYMHASTAACGNAAARSPAAMADLAEQSRAALESLRAVVRLLRRASGDRERWARDSLDGIGGFARGLSAVGSTLEVDLCDGLERLPAEIAEAAFAVVRESVTNIIKHAPGAAVTVGLALGPSELTVDVENGVGSVPPGRAVPSGGVGLVGLAERLELVGGRLQTARTADGFRLTATFPLPSAATTAETMCNGVTA